MFIHMHWYVTNSAAVQRKWYLWGTRPLAFFFTINSKFSWANKEIWSGEWRVLNSLWRNQKMIFKWFIFCFYVSSVLLSVVQWFFSLTAIYCGHMKNKRDITKNKQLLWRKKKHYIFLCNILNKSYDRHFNKISGNFVNLQKKKKKTKQNKKRA